jgi:peptide deformylase
MTLRKIARLGHPVLLARASPVEDPRQAEIRRLIDDMVETMQDAPGVGLAAPQVHESLRIIIALEAAGPDRLPPLVLVNPELMPMDEEQEEGFEGCLSIPGLRGLVPRWRRVAWRAMDRNGEPIEGIAEGFFARVLQHEVDHLDGLLYPMRMTDMRQLAFESEFAGFQEWRRAQQERSA